MIGLLGWFGVASTYISLAHGKEIVVRRQRGVEFVLPMCETAVVNVVAQLFACAAVLWCDQIFVRDGIRKIGLSASRRSARTAGGPSRIERCDPVNAGRVGPRHVAVD